MRRGIVQLFGSQLASLVVLSVTAGALSRLLPPEAFGVFAQAAAAFTLLKLLVVLGLQKVLVRERAVTPAELRAAGGLSTALSGAVFLVTVFLAHAQSNGAALSEASSVSLFMTATLFTVSLTLPIQAALERSMRFGLLSVVASARTVADGVVAITLAALGYGAVALAAGFFFSHVVGLVVLAASVPADTRLWPRLGRVTRDWGSQFRIVSSSFIAKGGDLLVVVTIDALLGVAFLGIFNRAQAVNSLFQRVVLEGIEPTILTGMSRALERGSTPAAIYAVKFTHLSVLCWPSFGLLMLLAPEIVAVILGEQWTQASPVVRILAAGGLAFPITQMSLHLFVALDLMRPYLRIVAIHQGIRAVLVSLAALHSLEAVAAAVAASVVIKAFLIMAALEKRIGYDLRTLLVPSVRAIAVTAAALAGPLCVLWYGADHSALQTLALALPLAGAGWLAAVALMRHPIAGEILAVARSALRARAVRSA